MTKSKIFLYFCLSFIVGIFISSMGILPGSREIILLPVLILGILLISVFWSRKKLVVTGFCLLFLVVGIWRHQAAESKIIHPSEKEVSFVGTIVAEPDIRETHTKITLIEAEPQSIQGKIFVTVSRYPEYHYGDRLKITGNLEIPYVFDDFNYQDYLAKDGIYSVMYFPEIEFLERNDRGLASVTYGKILEVKNELRKSIYQNLSPPQSSILGAIILGDKRKMSDELKEKLNITGIRHITAISGMHVMILAGILMYLGLSLGFSRLSSFCFTLILLFLFITMVGFPSSAVRAGIMGSLYLLAQALGRPKTSSRAVIFAAAVMLAISPLLLKSDVGFQLSFLAVMGIIYLMPFLQHWLKFRVLAMTLAAQVFTLPLLVYNFGYASLLAPLTNILIVPLLPFIMILGFVAALCGIIWQTLGFVLSWPVWFLLTYLTKTVDLFSRIPLASITLEISWLWLLACYLVLGCLVWQLNKRQEIW